MFHQYPPVNSPGDEIPEEVSDVLIRRELCGRRRNPRSPGEGFEDGAGIFRSVGDNYVDYSGVLRSPGEDFIDNSETLRPPAKVS